MVFRTKALVLTLLIVYAVLVSCSNHNNRIKSKNYSTSQKIAILKEKIELKSPIEWAEFDLYDANGDSASIPGASNKNFKIVIKVDPKFSNAWILGKENWITSFPHNHEWINEILNPDQLAIIKGIGYLTLYNHESGYTYKLWVNQERGIILMWYIQE